MNLMQFARKAGKVIYGADACIRSLHRRHIHVLILAEDLSENSLKKIQNIIAENKYKVTIISLGTQKEISQALGLPITGIIGVMDKQFAAKIIEYWTAEVEEPCSR